MAMLLRMLLPLLASLSASLLATPALWAQASSGENATTQEAPSYSQAELDQMLAPVALYPDSLLSQLLMAATYPAELVEASRWSRDHPGLEGQDAVDAAAGQGWDPSVQALAAFPGVLRRMDEQLRWTRRLGQAFRYQEEQVMDTIQALRERARAAGYLNDPEHARVHREENDIIIAPRRTEVIYVPYYNPRVVYGDWWRPAHPPVHWGGGGSSFGAGMHWHEGVRGSATLFFSTFDWRRRHVVSINPRLHPHKTHLIHGRHPLAYRDLYRHGYQRWQHRPHRNPGGLKAARRYGPYSAPVPRPQREAVRHDSRPGPGRRDYDTGHRSRQAGPAPSWRGDARRNAERRAGYPVGGRRDAVPQGRHDATRQHSRGVGEHRAPARHSGDGMRFRRSGRDVGIEFRRKENRGRHRGR